MEAVIEVLIGGLGLGSVYAVAAIGFAIVYRATGVLNLAAGTIGATGALILASLIGDGGFGIAALAGANPLRPFADGLAGWLVNLVLAMLLAALVGIAAERVAVRPLLGRPEFTVTVATIGVWISLGTIVDQAPIPRDLRIPWSSDTWSLGPATITVSSVVSIVIGVLAFVSLAAFNRTRTGLAMRAVASDPEAAAAQGIDNRRVFATTWALAASLATVAAVAFSFAPPGQGSIATSQTPALFTRALPAIALGGWDSTNGAYLGGLIIGVVQVGAGRWLSGYTDTLGAGYSATLPYLLMMVVLLVRPAGAFGAPVIRRV